MNLRLSSTVLFCLTPLLSGCVTTRVHMVRRTRPPTIVESEPLPSLIADLTRRNNAIQSMSATIELVASTGGGQTGQVKEYPSFSGYIFLRKPEDLRVLLLVPVLRSKALDMVSDGKSFTLLIPPRNRAIVGTNSPVSKPSSNGLENLRPYVFFDSLLVQGPGPDEIVSRTLDTRLLEDPVTKDLIEEPDYDVAMLGKPEGPIAHTERVVHISRQTLLPYRQDIYDRAGQIVTRASYSNYQDFGPIRFPTTIHIDRPLDQYAITLTFTKITFNEKLDDDQFELKVPDGVQIQHMP